jgi:hypothetical protein
MAGAEAELELLGRPAIGDGDDRYQIELMAERLCCSPPWEKLEPRLRAMNRMLVGRHRALIERLAKELLKKTTLTETPYRLQALIPKILRCRISASDFGHLVNEPQDQLERSFGQLPYERGGKSLGNIFERG